MRKIVSPILVTGCSRSGTSMVTGVLKLCGAFLGDTPSPKKGGYRGVLENRRIHDEMLVPYLKLANADLAGQYPLLSTRGLYLPADWAERVGCILGEEGYDEKTGIPWLYKSGKLASTWPIWANAFPDAKWVIVRRRTGDVIESCVKTAYMKAFKNPAIRELVGVATEEEGWKWWVHRHEEYFVDMIQAGLNVKVVWPERMVQGNYAQMYETVEWLGLSWKTEVLSYIDPKFWRVRRGENNGL